MAKCRKPGCPAQSDGVSPYCAAHKGTLNVVLPVTPMRVQVMEQLEWDRMEAEMQTRARSASAAPPRALATVAPSPPPPRRPGPPASRVVLDQEKNKERMRVSYAALLESNRTDAQLLAPLINAFAEIKSAPTFQSYMNEEIGWLNLNSWFSWLSRTIAPAMMMRPIAEEVRDVLRRKSLLAGVGGRMFADRYFFELSLYCDAVIMQKDVSFIFGQASQVLGPILAPIAAAVSSAVPVVGRGIKPAVEAAAKFGIRKAVVEQPRYETIPANAKPDDPMRFTLAWLDFVTNERAPAEAVATVLAEFGGRRGCESLYEWLMSANL